jgi:hypothetical protein
MQALIFSTSLIVRLNVTEDGAVQGVVERPRTGEKHRFDGVEALGVIVARIARAQSARIIRDRGGHP